MMKKEKNKNKAAYMRKKIYDKRKMYERLYKAKKKNDKERKRKKKDILNSLTACITVYLGNGKGQTYINRREKYTRQKIIGTRKYYKTTIHRHETQKHNKTVEEHKTHNDIDFSSEGTGSIPDAQCGNNTGILHCIFIDSLRLFLTAKEAAQGQLKEKKG